MLYPTIALLVFSFASLPVFIVLLRKLPLWVAWAFLGLVALVNVFIAFYTLITFSGAFGPGIVLFCSAFLVVPVLLLGWLLARRVLFRGFNRSQRIVYVVGGLMLIVMQTAPILGDYVIGGYCDWQAMRVGDKIIAAIRQYEQQNAGYPPQIEQLVPEYLPANPTYQCFRVPGIEYDWSEAHYRLEKCSDHVVLLTTSSTDGARVLRYNFETGNWSGISFLDGVCSFLR